MKQNNSRNTTQSNHNDLIKLMKQASPTEIENIKVLNSLMTKLKQPPLATCMIDEVEYCVLDLTPAEYHMLAVLVVHYGLVVTDSCLQAYANLLGSSRRKPTAIKKANLPLSKAAKKNTGSC